MRLLPTISLCCWLGLAQAGSIQILIQRSPLAGSQYYALDDLWTQIAVGDELSLIREPDNRHDRDAVRVEWQGRKLGYVPRTENRAVAEAMDAGEHLKARVARISAHPDPWRRVEFEVYMAL